MALVAKQSGGGQLGRVRPLLAPRIDRRTTFILDGEINTRPLGHFA